MNPSPQELQGLQITPVTLERLAPTDYFLQTPLWGTFRKSQGWAPYSFNLTIGQKNYPLLVLVRPLGAGASIAYVPHAPEGVTPTTANLVNIGKILKPLLPRSTAFLRWDLPQGTTWEVESNQEELFPLPLDPPLKKAVDVQPPDTVILSLALSEDALLEQMHKKTRYNIRLAEKKGVTIREAGVEELPVWYGLYQTTAQRDKISIHPESYYRGLFETAKDFKEFPVKLWLAVHEDQVLAGIITIKSRNRVTYLYGASSNEGRNLMPAYLLQWEAIQWAKEQNAGSYDFFGIPPTGDENHPMHGLYRFKTGFGGVIHHRLGSWDQVFKPWIYLGINASERLRTWYYKVWKKRT